MRFAERLFGVERRAWNPEDPTRALTGADYNRWFKWGDGAAGPTVSESEALGLSAYWRSVSLISGSMAMLPVRVYRRGTRSLVSSQTVLDSPNLEQTPFEFWQTLYLQQLSWGNAYAMKWRDAAGNVNRVETIHPSRVSVEKAPAGKVFTVVDNNGDKHVFSPFDVAHFPFMAPNGVVGMSPLQAFRRMLSTAIQAETTQERFMLNGTRLSGILTTKDALSETQAKQIKSRWSDLFSGAGNAGEVAVLDNGASYSTVMLPPADAQILETRDFSIGEIARMFGMPSHLLNDQEKATAWGSGIESMGIGLVVYTLQPRITATEQRITREFLPGGWDSGSWDARIELKALLRGDAAARSSFYRAMTDLKAMTNHQVAELEDMDLPAGDPVYAMPSNYALVDAASGAVTPLAGAPSDGEEMSARDLAETLQKIYLAVGTVVTADEARAILNRAGAGLAPGGLAVEATGAGTNDEGAA